MFLKYLLTLLCSSDFASGVDGVVVVKIVSVVAQSGSVLQVTLKLPPRPPKNTFIFYLYNCVRLYFIAQLGEHKNVARL